MIYGTFCELQPDVNVKFISLIIFSPFFFFFAERTAVAKLVGLHFVVGVFQFIWAMLGLLIVANPEQLVSCPDIRDQNHIDILVAVIAISQLTDLCIKCCCCVLLAGNEEAERGLPMFETNSYAVIERRWHVSSFCWTPYRQFFSPKY